MPYSRPSAQRECRTCWRYRGCTWRWLCGLFSFGRRWKFYKPLIILRGAVALFYVLLTGVPVSVLRAGLVFAVALAGDFLLLPFDLLTATGFAAILMGLQNAYAPCDIGFQLSFCAVLGVQAAAALTCAEERAAEDKPAAVRLLCRLAEPVQSAALASLATLPVLVAHGMAASLAGLVCNVLVVWMLQPALQMGILLLAVSAVPFLLPFTNLTALLLSLWLKLLLWLVERCAALPFASVCLPQRYTLFVLAVLGMLAAAYWHAKKAAGLPARSGRLRGAGCGHGTVDAKGRCAAGSRGCGQQPLRGLRAEWKDGGVFPRRGEQPGRREKLPCRRSRGEPALLVDLRAKPTELDFAAAEVVTMQEQPNFATRPVLDGLALDLYHNKSASLAVLEVGGRHIAVGAGNIQLAEPVRVDVLCAPGSWPDAVQPDTVLYTSTAPKWLDKAENCTLRYGEEEPGLTMRPGRSILWEEAQTVAVQ